MDKIAFLQQLCQISNDVNKNTENLNLAMTGYDAALNVAYDALHAIAKDCKSQVPPIIIPYNFRNGVTSPVEIGFKFPAKQKVTVTCGGPYVHSCGVAWILKKNPKDSGYLISIQV
jgi:hypothetical protein